jgi:hypothetical protein
MNKGATNCRIEARGVFLNLLFDSKLLLIAAPGQLGRWSSL